MEKLKTGLVCGVLFICIILGLQASFLMTQLGRYAVEKNDEITALLLNANYAVMAVRNAAETQAKFQHATAARIKATAGTAQIAMARLARLIEHQDSNIGLFLANTDSRAERLTQQAETLAGGLTAMSSDAQRQINELGYEGRRSLAELSKTFKALEALANDPALKQASANLEAATRETIEATHNAALATQHIEAALRPLTKPLGKLRWALRVAVQSAIARVKFF